MDEPKGRQYAKEIAEIFDGDEAQIEDILRLSREKDVYFHGVKYKDNIPKISKEEFNSKTPEGGCVSFWTRGLSLFISGFTRGGEIQTYDTSFFHYGGGKDGCLIITDGSYMNKLNIKPTSEGVDSQATTKGTFPLGTFSILKMDAKDTQFEGRESGKFYEREMASFMKDFLDTYLAGETSTYLKRSVVRNSIGEIYRNTEALEF